MKTTDNTILIAGGGSGIGRGLAEAFHKLGNTVIIAGRRESVLAETTAANPGMEFLTLDTASLDSITHAAAEIKMRFPSLNVLINNAGILNFLNFSSDSDPVLNDETLNSEIQTNISGVLRMTSAFLPQLRQQAASTVINISSGLAFVPNARAPIYSASKAFVHSFSMSLREQLKNTSVKVIELAPPLVETDLFVGNTGGGAMPLRDFIAAAMQDLASDEVELKVAGAKFFYTGGVSENLYPTFSKINH
ncbi:SDR family NAD(P)-dependent oxidoreductase [Granulicella sp. dw_53]|uniref:SDR family oxidoreductase n=1 Tax=Granulicella sp. dw_53 TaxID=2719792 RepID=UPI001BD38AF6|nr:SDR family NAD(P)-dependent oxidoreductase [Granulicella sp. dw_53]